MARLHENIIDLTPDERARLERGCRTGNWSVRKVRRARVFLLANVVKDAKEKPRGEEEIAKKAECSKATVCNLRRRFQSERLGALEDKPRAGRPRIIDGQIEAQMIAIACSEAPEGRERWTLKLIANRLVTLVDELEDVSCSTVGKALKKTNLNRG